jgi:hypothetical protein
MKNKILAFLLIIVVIGFLMGQQRSLAQIDKENIKYIYWVLHSQQPGDTTVLHNLTTPPTPWIQIQLYEGGGTCWNDYHCYKWKDNGDLRLSPSDTLFMSWETVRGVPRPETTCYWMHVQEVTLTLFVTKVGSPSDSMFLEFTGGTNHDSLARAIDTARCTWWHEIYPIYSPYFHIDSIYTAPLSTGDTIKFNDGTRWQVVEWAIDFTIDAHGYVECPPYTPTMTQWGIIILVVLLIASAVFVGFKRRKAAVPA